MGLWRGLYSYLLPGGSSSKAYPAAARRSTRIGDAMPYSRVYPEHLLVDLFILRARSKWLLRANGYARAAARDMATLIVGRTGFVPGFDDVLWREWRQNPVQCDVQGLLTYVALQWLAAHAVVTTGEAFVVRRARRADSAWPLPIQLDVFDGDALAVGGQVAAIRPGHRVLYGIEYSARGRRVAYHFRIPHPAGGSEQTIRVAASDVVHLFDPCETGMQRGVPWFASVVIRLADLDSYHEASLKKANRAADIAVVTSKIEDEEEGDGRMLPGEGDDESLAPGWELPITPGSKAYPFPGVESDGLREYTDVSLQTVGAAIGTGFELLTGDYRGMPFSAARMSRGERDERVAGLRERWAAPGWRRVFSWVREAATVRGLSWPMAGEFEWPDPPAIPVEPDKDTRTSTAAVRSGFVPWSDEVRRRGYVPEALAERLAADQALWDAKGLSLDVDPRRLTAQGQAQSVPAKPPDDPNVRAMVEAAEGLRMAADDLIAVASRRERS